MRKAPLMSGGFPQSPAVMGCANLTGKYGDHLPLNWLEKIQGRRGLKITKSTMSRAICSVAAVPELIVENTKTDLPASGLVHIDDTPVQLLDESKSSHSNLVCFWALGNKEAMIFELSAINQLASIAIL